MDWDVATQLETEIACLKRSREPDGSYVVVCSLLSDGHGEGRKIKGKGVYTSARSARDHVKKHHAAIDGAAVDLDICQAGDLAGAPYTASWLESLGAHAEFADDHEPSAIEPHLAVDMEAYVQLDVAGSETDTSVEAEEPNQHPLGRMIDSDEEVLGGAVLPPLSESDEDLLLAGHAADVQHVVPGEAHGLDRSIPSIIHLLRDRRPRKSSAAYLFERRLQPIADGHKRSPLQVAYSHVELKAGGATNTVLDKVALHDFLLLDEFEGPQTKQGILLPKSFHMTKAILGTEEAAVFEFGWCGGCSFRYPPDPSLSSKTQDEVLLETCPRCGSEKYQVLSRSWTCTYSGSL